MSNFAYENIFLSAADCHWRALFHDRVCVAADRQEIIVSAAISLKNAFEEIGKVFEEKYKGIKVNFNFGASGDLVRQIRGGAPVDVFASAALKDMDEAESEGPYHCPDSRIKFAGNSVVLVMPADSQNLQYKPFRDLGQNQVGKIAVGQPENRSGRDVC